ncbi:MAG: 30S ribosomal protein S12 methylthiotransferase RimO [Coriobacteriales bacterium]|jgi:ribosomal protein S12 methylthiotransferase|nr:30S ribosomal protein S12 methylthiotransferase RimO [Coriobacteriales bacterium]
MHALERTCFLTLGCSKNEVDSDKMRALAEADPARLVVDDPACADLIVINTCAFITAAIEEALSLIFDVLELPRVKSGQTKVVVAGCLASRYGDELAKSLPEVKFFLPCDEELVFFAPPAPTAEAVSQASGSVEVGSEPGSARPALRTTGQAWAYLKIADGCSRSCSFCSIPAIKGPFRSASQDAILAEADQLVTSGAAELDLIAQDSGLWHSAGHDLADLLELLAERFPDTWLRVLYLYPETVSDKLLAVFDAHANICDYFDLPFQHGDPAVLQAMKRPGGASEYLRLIAKIRDRLPDAAIRTTLISGFPGESAAQHRNLLHFIEQASFDSGGVFAYSRELGTAAFDLHPQHGESLKLARQQEANDLLQSIAADKLQALVGRRVEVLLEGRDEDGLTARSRQMAPEVDALIHLPEGADAKLGGVLQVRIEEAAGFDLFASLL